MGSLIRIFFKFQTNLFIVQVPYDLKKKILYSFEKKLKNEHNVTNVGYVFVTRFNMPPKNFLGD